MADALPFCADPLMLAACRLLRAQGNEATARLLAVSAQRFSTYDNGGFTQEAEPLTLKLGLDAAALGLLAEETVEAHVELIQQAMNQVFMNLDGYRVARVQVMPKLESIPGWREPFLEGRELGPSQEIHAWQLLPKNVSAYELLGVGSPVSEEKLKAAWRRMMLECHPDRNRGQEKEAEEVSKRINAAYEEILEAQRLQASSGDIPF